MPSYVFADPKLFPVRFLGFVDPTDHYAYRGILTESGELRKYDSFDELLQHIRQRREANGYEKLDHLELQIQHYLYLIGEAPRSHFIRATDLEADIPRTIQSDAIAGAKIAFELSRQAITGLFRAGASGWATKQEAERRAETCINCPKNIELRKSKYQRMNNKIAALFTAKRSTSYDDRLFDCGVCGCPLVEKVQYSEEVVKQATPKKFKAEHFPDTFIGTVDRERHECWMHQILKKEN